MPQDPPKIASPWEQLETLVDEGDGAAVAAYLESLTSSETAYAISRMDEETHSKLLVLLPAEVAADLVEILSDTQAVDLIESVPHDRAAAIVDQMVSDEQADLITELDKEDADAILDRMNPEEAEDVRRLTRYGPDTAGGIMITEYLAYPQNLKVDDILNGLRSQVKKYAGYDVQYLYVVDREGGKLVGIVRLRELILSEGSTPITSVMLTKMHVVQVSADLDELEDFFDRHDFFGAPVVDEAGCLVGVVRRAYVEEALTERADKAMLRVRGIIGGEELRTMPLLPRAAKRLAFLAPNIGLNLVAVSVIAFFEPTLAKVSALMIFLPILSDMSGCSGNQAVAVSMRELALGVVKPFEILRVLSKEASVGVINGVVLGLALGLIAWVMRGDVYPYLGLVVGLAMAVNSLVSVCVGGTIPLVLKSIKVDPALASGPMLTTITDLCGFFFALVFAKVMIEQTGLA